MKKIIVFLMAATFLLIQPVLAETPKPRVRLETSHGNIILLLYPDKAPKTVDNFRIAEVKPLDLITPPNRA